MSYCERKNISCHNDILNVILTFVEIYQYIFYKTVQNPKLIITAYDFENRKTVTFMIDTKYSHNVKQTIIKEYCALVHKNKILENINSISEIVLYGKGNRGYKEQTIYANPDIPCYPMWEQSEDYL